MSDIDRLRARGGGDCPELAFAGMLNAINEGPKYGSPMFVFTDASPKDATSSNMASLKAAAESNDATITFFTNLKGCTSGSKRGIEDYKEIASYTGGKRIDQTETDMLREAAVEAYCEDFRIFPRKSVHARVFLLTCTLKV